MKHFLGSVGVRGSVRGPFFTRHRATVPIKTIGTVARFFQKQITINKFWGTCDQTQMGCISQFVSNSYGYGRQGLSI